MQKHQNQMLYTLYHFYTSKLQFSFFSHCLIIGEQRPHCVVSAIDTRCEKSQFQLMQIKDFLQDIL